MAYTDDDAPGRDEQQPSDTLKPWLTVPLGRGIGSVTFGSAEQAVAWLEAERSYWGALKQHASPGDGFNTGLDLLKRARAPLLAASADPNTALRHREDAVAHWVAAYGEQDHQLAAPGSATRLRMDRWVEAKRQKVAATYFLSLRGLAIHTADAESLVGTIAGLLERFPSDLIFDGGAQVEAATGALVKLHSDQQEILERTRAQLVEVLGEAVLSQGQARSSLDDQNAKFLAEIPVREQRFEAQQKDHTAKFNELQALYKEHLSIKAPATYWRSRMTRHIWGAVVAGFVTLLGMIGIAVGVLNHREWLATPVKPDGAADPWAIGLLALAAVFVV